VESGVSYSRWKSLGKKAPGMPPLGERCRGRYPGIMEQQEQRFRRGNIVAVKVISQEYRQ